MADKPIKEMTYEEVVLELASVGEQIAAIAEKQQQLIADTIARLRKIFPLCANCQERPPMKDTPYCEVCRDEMEDRYAEEARSERDTPWEV